MVDPALQARLTNVESQLNLALDQIRQLSARVTQLENQVAQVRQASGS